MFNISIFKNKKPKDSLNLKNYQKCKICHIIALYKTISVKILFLSSSFPCN